MNLKIDPILEFFSHLSIGLPAATRALPHDRLTSLAVTLVGLPNLGNPPEDEDPDEVAMVIYNEHEPSSSIQIRALERRTAFVGDYLRFLVRVDVLIHEVGTACQFERLCTDSPQVHAQALLPEIAVLIGTVFGQRVLPHFENWGGPAFKKLDARALAARPQSINPPDAVVIQFARLTDLQP